MLAVGLFAHLDVCDRIIPFLEVSNFGGGIVRRSVKHGDRNHGGKIVGDPTGEEKIESAVLIAACGIHISG